MNSYKMTRRSADEIVQALHGELFFLDNFIKAVRMNPIFALQLHRFLKGVKAERLGGYHEKKD